MYIRSFENKIRKSYSKKYKDMRKNIMYKMPEKGMKEETILKRTIEGSNEASVTTENGTKISGCVYINDESHWEFMVEVMRHHLTSNPLHISEFVYVG